MADEKQGWLASLEKSPEFWMAVIGTALYLATRNAEEAPIWIRTVKVVASALLAIGVGPDLAEYFGGKETIATVFVMASGIFILDLLTGLLGDRDEIKKTVHAYVRNKFGVKKDDVE